MLPLTAINQINFQTTNRLVFFLKFLRNELLGVTKGTMVCEKPHSLSALYIFFEALGKVLSKAQELVLVIPPSRQVQTLVPGTRHWVPVL
jgi:hypothetical protein